MHLSLRTKLVLIVGATAISLSGVVALGVQLAWRQTQNLEELEQRLVPKLGLEPRLASQFEQLGQALRDGVAAQDRAALDATGELRDEIYAVIERAGPALSPAAAEELRAAIGRYHRSALQVSRRLLDGDAGEQVVEEMAAMQEQHKHAVAVIERSARLDRATLRSGFAAVHDASRGAARYGVALGLGSLALIVGLSTWLGRGAFRSLGRIAEGFERFAAGRLDEPIVTSSHDELGTLAHEANRMAAALDRLGKQRDTSDWIKAGQVELSEKLRGELELEQAARSAVEYLSERVGALVGALYLDRGKGCFELSASYAFPDAEGDPRARRFAPGEALVGRAAMEDTLRVIEAVPQGYLQVRSGLGQAHPSCLLLIPLRRGPRAIGVVELALFGPVSDAAREFLGLVREGLAVTLDSAQSHARLRELLEESRTLASRLAAQEEELLRSNDELSAQKEELARANDELEAQRTSLHLRNAELELARASLQKQADELTQMSSYKSQFLANMSHELRTPLNSMLLLSQILADNDAGNLSQKQVDYCRTICSAGKGLLSLINQVLDLSKIEAGKQELDVTDVVVADLAQHLMSSFEPQFSRKGLSFSLAIAPDVPPLIRVDGSSLQRILINLLGNALKFTERGGVSLTISRPAPGTRVERPLDLAHSVAFAVRDTGIGIPIGDQPRIFARFEQADARTVRRFGGTGLGLSIARESAQLMGGDLSVQSVDGEGSTFTCILPEWVSESEGADPKRAPPSAADAPALADDRADLTDDEPHLLIVEDDPVFAEQLLEEVRGLRLKGIVASGGREALRLARLHLPAGVVLDVKLPDINGFAVRDELLRDERTAGIPVHFVSALEAPRGLVALEAVGYLTKPASRADLSGVIQTLIRPESAAGIRVLLVEDDEDQSNSVVNLLREAELESVHARTAHEAMRALERERFGCMILDLGLPDEDGLELLDQVSARGDICLPPVVVHTARALSRDERRRLGDYAQAVVSKEDHSMQRVLEEVRAFVGRLREPQPLRPADAGYDDVPAVVLDGASVLIADDDMRTAYALSALLRDRGADVIVAENGREALRALEEHAHVNAVLMDIMMPDMDGYEALRRLREQPRFAALPVIALTDRALQGEKERCEAAGASEYMTKPIDPRGLLTSLEHWLRRDPPQSSVP